MSRRVRIASGSRHEVIGESPFRTDWPQAPATTGLPPPRAIAIGGVGRKGLTSSFMLPTGSNPTLDLGGLYQQALQAAGNSYSPYSGFRVGAALLLTSGEVFTGTNVENVSYGLTLCAERAALATAVSQLGPGVRIAAVAVANLNQAPSPPCGACRQVLAEFVLQNAPILFPAADGPRTMPFAELLPLAFNLKQKEG